MTAIRIDAPRRLDKNSRFAIHRDRRSLNSGVKTETHGNVAFVLEVMNPKQAQEPILERFRTKDVSVYCIFGVCRTLNVNHEGTTPFRRANA